LGIQSEEAGRLKNRLRAGSSMWNPSVVMAICRDVKGWTDVQLLRFQSGEQALLNVRPEFRWMVSSSARESFADASRERAKWLNRVWRRQQQIRRQTQKLNQAAL